MSNNEKEKDENLILKWKNILQLPQKEMKKSLKELNLSEKTSLNQNILHISCMESNKIGIEEILSINKNKKTLNINLQDKIKNWSPIMYLLDSSDLGEPDSLILLIKNNVNINIKDNKGITPLHLAAFKGQDENVEILINSNANVNSKDCLGRIPLTFSIIEGQINSAQLLIDKSDLSTLDINNNSLLHYAVLTKGNALLFTIMLSDRKINLNTINNEGNTPIMLVALNNPNENVRLLQKLLSLNCIVDGIVNNKGQSFYSILGEDAIKNHFGGNDIDVNEENNKVINRIKNNSRFDFMNIFIFFIIPILIISKVIK